MISKLNSKISFQDCRFKLSKQYEKTARITLFKELRVQQVYTLEASFFGYKHQSSAHHFKIPDYLKIGEDILLTLY